MICIPHWVDQHASASLLKTRKSPIKGLAVARFRQFLAARIAGTPRAGDRLHAAGLCDTDTCQCGQRQTLEHLLWHCSLHRHRRNDYMKCIKKIRGWAHHKGPRVEQYISAIFMNTCFRHTGISHSDDDAAQFAAEQRDMTKGKIVQRNAITSTDANIQFVYDESGRFIAAFTDGSASLVHDPYLAHGGWGVFFGEGHPGNSHGSLPGMPLSSFRTEVKAIL